MSIFKKLFDNKPENIASYADFWNWFKDNEKTFYNVIKNKGDIQKSFFNKLGPKLDQINEGIWFLVGMTDDTTAEIIFTPDGIIKNIVFVEELVRAAPDLEHWKFTALKQPSKPDNPFGIEMEGYKFDADKLSFYATDHPNMPDIIDLTIAYKDYNGQDKSVMDNGVYLTLDNNLGELNSVTAIDRLNIIDPSDATQELIPFNKLNDFLIWREKEFVEKYHGLRHDTENDTYSSMEATLENGLPLIAIVNTDLLQWDSKASHPWIATVKIAYNGENNNGLPDSDTYQLLNEIEDQIMKELKDSEGYLNIGRETADSLREVYFACIDFRKPSKVLHNMQQDYKNKLDITFDLYKDKYWQSFDRYLPHH
ncbi:DUF695 domain-containing protein [Gelidibacter pelagius]|uniref:DUF695 domain-containing protein n=1 Tax=Gelidibacter pelagius TaxID=2819985 RepID=A0ABS3SP75_9FLAO|nr:DUF695 domain-containing protein [Gelidibacter pelagius]MBO3097515.1 DUF695 domain-containing protein [Gelidibacter pelagius]